MKCSKREGSKGCSWWVSGCIHPEVPAEVKQECAKGAQRLEKEALCLSAKT